MKPIKVSDFLNILKNDVEKKFHDIFNHEIEEKFIELIRLYYPKYKPYNGVICTDKIQTYSDLIPGQFPQIGFCVEMINNIIAQTACFINAVKYDPIAQTISDISNLHKICNIENDIGKITENFCKIRKDYAIRHKLTEL